MPADQQTASSACHPRDSSLPCQWSFLCVLSRPYIDSRLIRRDATHYVMPDAAAVVAWLEVLEQPEMGGFVLLTSVLKQARPVHDKPGGLIMHGSWHRVQHAAQP